MASRNRALAPASQAPQARSSRVVPGLLAATGRRPMRFDATQGDDQREEASPRPPDRRRAATCPASSPAASRHTKKMPKPAPAPSASSEDPRTASTSAGPSASGSRGRAARWPPGRGGCRQGDGPGTLAAGDADDATGTTAASTAVVGATTLIVPVGQRPVEQEDADPADQAADRAEPRSPGAGRRPATRRASEERARPARSWRWRATPPPPPAGARRQARRRSRRRRRRTRRGGRGGRPRLPGLSGPRRLHLHPRRSPCRSPVGPEHAQAHDRGHDEGADGRVERPGGSSPSDRHRRSRSRRHQRLRRPGPAPRTGGDPRRPARCSRTRHRGRWPRAARLARRRGPTRRTGPRRRRR